MRERGNERRERAGKKSQGHRIDDIHIGPRYHDRRHGDSRPLSKIEPHLIPAPACTETLVGALARQKQMLKERLIWTARPSNQQGLLMTLQTCRDDPRRPARVGSMFGDQQIGLPNRIICLVSLAKRPRSIDGNASLARQQEAQKNHSYPLYAVDSRLL